MKGVFLCGCTTNAAGSKANGAVFCPGSALKTGGDTTGRNHKIGLEWWPRDIGLFRDPKLRSVRQEFGVLGPYIYECLLDIAYGDKGYYISYSGRGREDVLWQLSEYVAGRYAVPAETIANVIDRLVECELFSGDLYKRGFITSKRMQMCYFIATLGRSGVQVNFDLWLPSEEEMREKNPSGKSFLLQSFISWQEKHISRQETDISQPESTQSRGQYSRAENRTVEDSTVQQRTAEQRSAASALVTELEELMDCKFDRNFCLELTRLSKAGMQREVFLDAVHKTGERRPRNPAAYFRTILQGYERDGVLTAADLAATAAKPEPAPVDPPAERPLADWEQAWLAQKAEIRKRRQEAIERGEEVD